VAKVVVISDTHIPKVGEGLPGEILEAAGSADLFPMHFFLTRLFSVETGRDGFKGLVRIRRFPWRRWW